MSSSLYQLQGQPNLIDLSMVVATSVEVNHVAVHLNGIGKWLSMPYVHHVAAEEALGALNQALMEYGNSLRKEPFFTKLPESGGLIELTNLRSVQKYYNTNEPVMHFIRLTYIGNSVELDTHMVSSKFDRDRDFEHIQRELARLGMTLPMK